MYFTETVGTVARGAGVSECLVRRYVDLGLVPAIRDSAGRRLLPDDAVAIVTAALASRMDRRGARPR